MFTLHSLKIPLKALKIPHCEQVGWGDAYACCLCVKPPLRSQSWSTRAAPCAWSASVPGSCSTRASCRCGCREGKVWPHQYCPSKWEASSFRPVQEAMIVIAGIWGLRQWEGLAQLDQKRCTNHPLTSVRLEVTSAEIPKKQRHSEKKVHLFLGVSLSRGSSTTVEGLATSKQSAWRNHLGRNYDKKTFVFSTRLPDAKDGQSLLPGGTQLWMCISAFRSLFSQGGAFANFCRETNHTCVLEILLLKGPVAFLMMGFRSAELFLDVAEPISLTFPGSTALPALFLSKVCLSFGLG